MSDRSTSAKYYEVQHVYSPVQFTQHGDDIYVINRNHHTALTDYECAFTVAENGSAQKTGRIALPDVAPGDSAVLTRLSAYKYNKEKDVRLNLSVTRKGQHVVTQQFALCDNLLAITNEKAKNGKAVANSSKATGRRDGENLFTLHSSLSPLPQFFRAPTDNDRSFGNWLAKDWTKNRLDSPRVVRPDVDTYICEYANGSIETRVKKTPAADGVELEYTFLCHGELPELPRMGIVIRLPKEYQNVSWYGRGPWENYPDRKESCPVGRYSGTVGELFTHYPRPQDNGNHEDCAEVIVGNDQGHSLRITAVDAPFSFSVLPFSAQQLAACAHDYELPASDGTYLSIDCAVLGLGNSSCGPGVLKKYSIDKSARHVLRIRVQSF